jgi:hypothetical protein
MAVRRIVGVMVNQIRADEGPIENDDFFRRLSQQGLRHGLSVVLFSPRDSAAERNVLPGYMLNNGTWTCGRFDLPDILYDRFFYRHRSELALVRTFLQAASACKPHQRLSAELPGKWTVYRALRRDDSLRRLLPDTAIFTASEDLDRLLDRHAGRLVLKPAAGMQGRGVISLIRVRQDGEIAVSGRSRSNLPLSLRFGETEDCRRWISRFTNNRAYLTQPLLDLHDPDDRPFDIRTLVQKDGGGRWRITGSAVRSGASGSLTSNLHGGGKAADAHPFLAGLFGRDRAGELLRQTASAGLRIAELLEQSFGRFAELGLDFGIDAAGKLWFLEANAKPGRAAFNRLTDGTAAFLSIERLLQYARFLLNRRFYPASVQPGNAPAHYKDVR